MVQPAASTKSSASLLELIQAADYLLFESAGTRRATADAGRIMERSLSELRQSRFELKADCRRMVALRMESQSLRGVSTTSYVLPYINSL